MKPLTHCPCCKDPLVNSFTESLRYGKELIRKYCSNKLDHKFSQVVDDNDQVYYVGVELDSEGKIRANWMLLEKKIFISKGEPEDQVIYDLPYFEPDFSSYKRLIVKLKTYNTFS